MGLVLSPWPVPVTSSRRWLPEPPRVRLIPARHRAQRGGIADHRIAPSHPNCIIRVLVRDYRRRTTAVGTIARHRQRARVPETRIILTAETKQTRRSREAGSIRPIVGTGGTNRERPSRLVVDSNAGVPTTVELRQEPR